MTTLQDIKDSLKTYLDKFRKPGLPELQWSEFYCLFPEKVGINDKLNHWPGQFPLADRFGVYFIFDENKELLYIGKASNNNAIGYRFGSYFMLDEDRKTCKIKNQNWTRKPFYLLSLAVPKEMIFEAPAIEEYLIKQLQPSDNGIGK